MNPHDSDPDDLFASPSRDATSTFRKHSATRSGDLSASTTQRTGESRYDSEQARETALQRELEGVRNINQMLEGVITSLETAKGNMNTVSKTVNSASTLLNTWTRILSQTEHNQRLILNPNWQGANADIADIEQEAIIKAQAAQRRAAEEERRRQDTLRKAEDEERQRQAGATRGRTTRGRGREPARGSVSKTPTTSYVGFGGRSTRGASSSAGSSRAGSSIGRGRARGVR